MNNEKALRDSLTEKLRKLRFHITHIESHQTAQGVPDIHYLAPMNYGAGWFELKHDDEFPAKLSLRNAQVFWLEDYAAHGGNCWVVLAVGGRAKGQTTIYVWDGKDARALQEDSRSVEPALKFFPSPEGWGHLAMLVRRG